uniref:GM04458p n=1 Tax=Drosophila melanogaster TaxID=7227 RepID=Q95SA7_DROME|nr:GM04458p [Drosophila melanogaster]
MSIGMVEIKLKSIYTQERCGNDTNEWMNSGSTIHLCARAHQIIPLCLAMFPFRFVPNPSPR